MMRIFKYTFSLFILGWLSAGAQTDTLGIGGLRFGFDLSRIAVPYLDEGRVEYDGSVDLRINKDLYPVIEVGWGDYKTEEILVDHIGKFEDLKDNYFQFDNQFNKNINSFNSYVGIGINYENTWYKPNINPEIYDNVFGLNNYHFSNLEIYAQYVYNTMNNVFFPAKGTFFQAELGRSLFHNVDVVFTDKNKPNINGATNGFTKFILKFEKRLVLNKNITGILGASSGFIFVV